MHCAGTAKRYVRPGSRAGDRLAAAMSEGRRELDAVERLILAELQLDGADHDA